MSRPTLEVADIVRASGNRFWEHYGSHLAWQHRKVLDAIVRCRTAALGATVEDRCSARHHASLSNPVYSRSSLQSGCTPRLPFWPFWPDFCPRHRSKVIEITINGKGPFKVFFDTGASVNFLDSGVIAQLSLPASNSVGRFSGLSGRPVDAKSFHVQELRIGDLTLNDQEFFNVTIPLPKSYAIVGAVGYPLFSRVLVKTDYAHHQLDLFDPVRFSSNRSGDKLDLQPDSNLIVVKAGIDGKIGDCLVDTGALGEPELMLNGWFVRRYHLVCSFVRRLSSEKSTRSFAPWMRSISTTRTLARYWPRTSR